MSNSQAVSVFNFQSSAVSVIADDKGEPWFLANDVCAVLGYLNPRQTIERHCRKGGVSKRDTPTKSGNQEMTWINEGNLYRLIIKSRKPEAEPFEAWVCDDVLPSIRKTGGYQVPTPPANPHLALRNTIHAVAKGNRQVYCNLYNSLYRKFQVTSYKDLDNAQCVAAVEFIKSVEGDYIARDKITPPKPSLALCDGQHYVVAKDGAVLMHKVLSHDINDSFLKQKATPCLSELQNVPLLTDKADYTQIRAALRQLVQVVDHYQPYSQVRPAVIVLETVERLLMRMWTMIDEASFRAAMVENYAKKGQPLKDYEHDTIKNISQILKQSMMMIDVPSFY